jgi:hypothetical protein
VFIEKTVVNIVCLNERPLGSVPGKAAGPPLVKDVQTDPPDPDINDPGAVLHEAVGNVNLIMIAVDNGPDRRVYAGPVLSHYEFEIPGTTRLTDAAWQAQLDAAEQPPPDWTLSYLVPQ